MDLVLPDVAGWNSSGVSGNSPEAQISRSGIWNRVGGRGRDGCGAVSFIEKPVDPNMLLAMLSKAREKEAIAAENHRLRDEVRDHTSFSSLVARSESMRRLFHMIDSVAVTDAGVLITGESGTGKELVASAIHRSSRRANGPLIKINCAAIPHDLIESELFGHKRGAFTGAVSDKTGLMELADGGTLLLDEVAEVPLHVQAKILRVLQDREFVRSANRSFSLIAGSSARPTSTSKGLKGKIREDLYFRINTVTLSIPALRERPKTFQCSSRHFLNQVLIPARARD